MQKIAILPLGMSLSLFLAVSFALCVAFGVLLPEGSTLKSWHDMFAFLTFRSWPSFIWRLGFFYGFGWYTAAVLAPLYNFFAARSA